MINTGGINDEVEKQVKNIATYEAIGSVHRSFQQKKLISPLPAYSDLKDKQKYHLGE
jgi:hypothetical protein